MGNVCPPGPNPLTVNLPVSHRKRFSALHFDYRPEDCSETLEVVNSNFSQRPYAAIVIPPRPSTRNQAIQHLKIGPDHIAGSDDSNRYWAQLSCSSCTVAAAGS